MKQTVVNIKYDEEKMGAIRQYMGKKDADFEEEMKDVMNKMYERYVPPAVREYIESRGEVPPLIKKAAFQSAKKTTSVSTKMESESDGFSMQ